MSKSQSSARQARMSRRPWRAAQCSKVSPASPGQPAPPSLCSSSRRMHSRPSCTSLKSRLGSPGAAMVTGARRGVKSPLTCPGVGVLYATWASVSHSGPHSGVGRGRNHAFLVWVVSAPANSLRRLLVARAPGVGKAVFLEAQHLGKLPPVRVSFWAKHWSGLAVVEPAAWRPSCRQAPVGARSHSA